MMVKESTMKYDNQEELSDNITPSEKKNVKMMTHIINVGPHIDDVAIFKSILNIPFFNILGLKIITHNT